MPAVAGTFDAQQNAARSRHAGGVNAPLRLLRRLLRRRDGAQSVAGPRHHGWRLRSPLLTNAPPFSLARARLRMSFKRIIFLVCLLACSAAVSGYGSQDPSRGEITGMVEVDGQPAAKGPLRYPIDGNSPASGGAIVDGRFKVNANVGPLQKSPSASPMSSANASSTIRPTAPSNRSRPSRSLRKIMTKRRSLLTLNQASTNRTTRSNRSNHERRRRVGS